jgi:hypothetical protein
MRSAKMGNPGEFWGITPSHRFDGLLFRFALYLSKNDWKGRGSSSIKSEARCAPLVICAQRAILKPCFPRKNAETSFYFVDSRAARG